MNPLVRGGRNTYGEAIGVIMVNKAKARIPGDVGNATTFDFPVRYRVVKEASTDTHRRADPSLLQPFIDAAKDLEKAGVKAITTCCGFLAFYQREIADAVSIPIFTSSLLLLPLIFRMLRSDEKIGVITAEAPFLDKRYFDRVGIDANLVVVAGMEKEPEFKRAVLDDEPSLDPEKLRDELVGVASNLVEEHPEVGAIVLECTQLPPYARAVQEAVHLPVFDIVTLTNMVFSAIVRKDFSGFM
jgi:aspartate/glutamate racemase